ncbi:hypothetical protein PENARI_c113G04154 [Penicillium arizonense]|uniref:Uncharacterized protein n=1 Tax=Penicillium arizonense TaxID=1835702 RepID=A0A1F5L146_PENAI|nr:hypothetical protein PENARI_c113G04154 [Penicillium arizonense]OGE46776.1 hypothetical protein PENARI_c113G04154 [Penicillium arizonense]
MAVFSQLLEMDEEEDRKISSTALYSFIEKGEEQVGVMEYYFHPGDQEDTDSYFMHCPGAAQPIVTFLGVVLERRGQLNDGRNLLHCRLQTTVYNPSTRTPHTFPITAFFKNGQRLANFPPLYANASVFVTGRIFGLTKENRQLAVVTDDIHFLPTSTNSLPPTPSSASGKRKRVDRWSQRAGPTTPSKSTSESHNPQLAKPMTANTPVDEDEESTQITWADTLDEPERSPQASTPTPERRSQRPRIRKLRPSRIAGISHSEDFFSLAR